MILRREDIQDKCSKILNTIDNNNISIINETVELVTIGNDLNINVTNGEYYVRIKLGLNEEVEELHAVVNAQLFLKLISQITTETIELSVKNDNLIIIGNGNYKLPMIYENNSMLQLPEINIENVVNTFTINNDILLSILTYNTRELNKGVASHPVQKLYYVDDKGAITFTSGACVNNFKLSASVKMLLNQRIVKLFRLFKNSSDVQFTIGYDPLSNGITQTKVKFETSDICITAILSCDDSFLNSVPEEAIRSRALKVYPNTIVVNKDDMLQTVNRLLLFDRNIKMYSKVVFSYQFMTIYDVEGNNKEDVYYQSPLNTSFEGYDLMIDLLDIKATLESLTSMYATINFGDNQAIVVTSGNIYNVIPEVRTV